MGERLPDRLPPLRPSFRNGAERTNGLGISFVNPCDNLEPADRGEDMVEEAAARVTTDEVVRRLLLARVDDAFRLATFILRDPLAAEDAVQEAALLAWERRRTLRDVLAADSWFTRIVVNVCRDELRRRGRRPRLVPLDPAEETGSGLSSADPDLVPAIARLTPDEQGLLALRFGLELTVPEVADRLGIPEGTVKSRLHATIERLRAAMAAERRAGESTR
jgi:RNA polymerase sigma factor (sigma-70 family)